METSSSNLALGAEPTEKLKLDGDSDDLPLVLRKSFDWIVSGTQVGAYWHRSGLAFDSSKHDNDDSQSSSMRHLGGATPSNAKDCPLCLWIGVSDERNELLVFLRQAVTSSKRSKTPRRMFLVVPAESLTISTSATGFGALALEQVPSCLFERPSDLRSAYANGFLHINFAIGSDQKSTVIMPARQYDGQVMGTTLRLMDGFKSLSESSYFDLYLRFNSYQQCSLQRLQKLMTDAGSHLPYSTPDFDVQQMYRGGRPGGYDLWKEQGWHEVKSDTRLRKRKAPERLETPPCYRSHQVASDLPPTYDEYNVADSPDPPQDRVSPSAPATTRVFVPRSSSPVDRALKDLSQGTGSSRVCETPLVQSAAQMNVQSVAPPHIVPEPLDTRFFKEVSDWLLSAWRICPLAHYKCIVYLLILASSAKNGNVETYEKARVACTLRLVSQEAIVNAADPDQALNITPAALTRESRDLIAWMLIVNRTADINLLSALVDFGKAVKFVQELADAEDEPSSDAVEFSRRYRSLLQVKAQIVSGVCFMYSNEALRSKESLVERISGEVKNLTRAS